MSSDVPISEQMEAVSYEVSRMTRILADTDSDEAESHLLKLKAALATLRKVQAGELVPLQDALDKFRDGLAKDFLGEKQ